MIRNSKTFIIGLVMLLSFSVIFAYIMSPSFEGGRNGLQYSDDMFNSLSKGSAYFIGEEKKKAEKLVGNNIDVTIKATDKEEAEKYAKLFSTAGAIVKVDDTKVSIQGDLGKLVKYSLEDCDAMYLNNGTKVKEKYGYEGRDAMYAWFTAFKKFDSELKNQKRFKEASAIASFSKKAIEPAYNYYNVEIKHVKDNVGSVTFMLIFYVVYTLWYGFGIYYLCDGLGITMTKAAKKSEA